ncbi:MAG TPA: CorA family divalent cation transporter [Solirubrobacterales bacterium]|nr:CorA family divalent cation transporter [Solirubrobacterales bacterium]
MSIWRQDGTSEVIGLKQLTDATGLIWFEFACGVDEAEAVLATVGKRCPGLTEAMLRDLLTPDEKPEGQRYDDDIRLASSFSVEARRPEKQVDRGTPQGVGVLRFQPVELLAGESWLVTCWHPRRIFQGSKKVDEQSPGEVEDLREAVAARWRRKPGERPGDLGISIMHELALTYAPAHRTLNAWLEDWELSLYIDDDLDNHDQLPELWGLMAVLRDWLSPLNKAGLRSDIGKAWLPVSEHSAVIEVDDRIDKALEQLGKLSETLRQSFGLLHLEHSEEQRKRSERVQRRNELLAAGFLVPTLIVGFYGANTWVPGQGRHWGFWVMVTLLAVLSVLVVTVFWRGHQRTEAELEAAEEDRRRKREELLRSS